VRPIKRSKSRCEISLCATDPRIALWCAKYGVQEDRISTAPFSPRRAFKVFLVIELTTTKSSVFLRRADRIPVRICRWTKKKPVVK
jgi:hypothetical protein